MIYLTFLIFATFANLTASSPAPTDCPRTKCHTATNECNMLYGGCWDECEDIADRLKTFTNPLCPSSTPFFATSLSIASASPTFVPTIISDLFPSAGIAVERLSGAGLGGPHTECTPLSICVDAMNDCGVRYGGCYDTCHLASLTVPPCPSASSTPASTYAIVSASGGKTTAVSSCTGMFCRPW